MKKPAPGKPEAKPVELSAVDVGRYLKKIASLNRDKKTGNPALCSALTKVADYLIETKAGSIEEALAAPTQKALPQFNQEEEPDPSGWTHAEIHERLSDARTTKKTLVSIGHSRLGIPISRLQKMGRDELLRTLMAAVEHEESIEILSNQAELGGTKRTS